MLKTMRKSAAASDESGRILAALRAGIDPGGAGFARRVVDTASACLWLTEGAPVADVLTMLEVRHCFDLSGADRRAYAVQILWAAQHSVDTRNPHPIPASKETRNAAA